MKRLQHFTFTTKQQYEEFLKDNHYMYFAGIHGINSYYNEETYISENKLYNILVGRRFWGGGAILTKQVNGLSIHKNLGGSYVNTSYGVIYINSLSEKIKR